MHPKVQFESDLGQFERTVPKLKSISGKSINRNLVTNWNTKSTNKHFRNNKDIVQSIWCNSTGFHRNPRNTKTRKEREIERGFTNQSGEGARFKVLSPNLKSRAKRLPAVALSLSLTLSFSLLSWRKQRKGKRWGRRKEKRKEKREV
jgi:hypothetical protein